MKNILLHTNEILLIIISCSVNKNIRLLNGIKKESIVPDGTHKSRHVIHQAFIQNNVRLKKVVSIYSVCSVILNKKFA